MRFDDALGGRMERRLPIIVVVRLVQAGVAATEEEEKTYTDNISAHGVRLFSRRAWKLQDEVVVSPVTPVKEEAGHGKVAYCQPLPDNRYAIGVDFKDRPIQWSVVRRHDGVLVGAPHATRVRNE